MTESAAPLRTKPQIEQEYFSLCLQHGDKSYKIKRFQVEMDGIQKKMWELDQEMLALEASIKAAKEPAPEITLVPAS